MPERNGNFIINSSVQKYKNPWINVREDRVTRADGKPGIFGVVEMKGGVSVLPLDDEGYVYLGREFHYAIGIEDIEAASGGTEKGETDLVSAKRELKEELGIEAEDWIDLGLVNPLTTVINSPQRIFLARKLKFTNTDQEEMEDVNTVKVKFDSAVDMVMDSVITHAPSCILILKAYKYLKDQQIAN